MAACTNYIHKGQPMNAYLFAFIFAILIVFGLILIFTGIYTLFKPEVRITGTYIIPEKRMHRSLNVLLICFGSALICIAISIVINRKHEQIIYQRHIDAQYHSNSNVHTIQYDFNTLQECQKYTTAAKVLVGTVRCIDYNGRSYWTKTIN